MIHGSQEVDFSDAGCPVGTTIVVRDVFFNTPARMKFLKKDSTEAGTIANIVDKIALANPQISFRFIRDGQVKLNTPGNGDLLSVIYAVYGKEFAADMIPVNYTHEFVTVSGFICRPTASRSTRSMQNFFINSRYVRSRTCMAALEEAYKSSIMTGKFPACVLNVQIPFNTVDVNVHPAKIEVRFSNERPVFDAVYRGCKEALGTAGEADFLPKEEPPKAAPSPFALKDFDHTACAAHDSGRVPQHDLRLPGKPPGGKACPGGSAEWQPYPAVARTGGGDGGPAGAPCRTACGQQLHSPGEPSGLHTPGQNLPGAGKAGAARPEFRAGACPHAFKAG